MKMSMHPDFEEMPSPAQAALERTDGALGELQKNMLEVPRREHRDLVAQKIHNGEKRTPPGPARLFFRNRAAAVALRQALLNFAFALVAALTLTGWFALAARGLHAVVPIVPTLAIGIFLSLVALVVLVAVKPASGLARRVQLLREHKREPKDLAHNIAWAKVQIEDKKATEAELPALAQEAQALREEGFDPTSADQDAKVGAVLLVASAAVATAGLALRFGGPGALAGLTGAVLAAVLAWALVDVATPWPELPKNELERPLKPTRAERKAAELEEVKRHRSALDEHMAKQAALVSKVRRLAAVYEAVRGFTADEQRSMGRRLRKMAWPYWLTLCGAVVLAFAAAYPSSCAIGRGLGLPPIRDFGQPIYPVLHLCMAGLLLYAEKTLGEKIAEALITGWGRRVLFNGYDPNSRVDGYRYVITTLDERKQVFRAMLVPVAFALLALLFEYSMVLTYLQGEGENSFLFNVLTAALPSIFIALAACSYGFLKEKRTWLIEATDGTRAPQTDDAPDNRLERMLAEERARRGLDRN